MKNKIILLGMLILAVFLIGCERTTNTKEVKEDVQLIGEVKEFVMTAKQWEFVPETIKVNQGDKIKLKITSTDVAHGFSLNEFGINEILEPGKTVEVEFIADKRGTFNFFCSVICGEGHGNMNGKLIVT